MNEYNTMIATSIVEEAEHGYISYGNLHDNDDRGLKLIAEALKKQIPMKPIKDEWSGHYCCSACATKTSKRILFGWEKRCVSCGQAIGWSEVE